MSTSLDILLNPRSVAMIGASGNVTRIDGRALRHLKKVGFGGDIFPGNPGWDEVQGLRAYRTIADIPGAVDCAVLALPTDAVRTIEINPLLVLGEGAGVLALDAVIEA